MNDLGKLVCYILLILAFLYWGCWAWEGWDDRHTSLMDGINSLLLWVWGYVLLHYWDWVE